MSIRIAALLAFHNEIRFLPSWFDSVGKHVDAVCALDDRSTDGSYEFVASRNETSSLQRVAAVEGESWNEPRNRHLLVTAGQKSGCDWFVAFDADERVEERFWEAARQLGTEALEQGVHAFQFHLREMWNSHRRYRVDGVWGQKIKAAFFSNLGEAHAFDPTLWHGEWISATAIGSAGCQLLPFNLYHLRMIRAADRRIRRDRYNQLDPEWEFQSIGYDYLTDETGLELAEISLAEDYNGVPNHLGFDFESDARSDRNLQTLSFKKAGKG